MRKFPFYCKKTGHFKANCHALSRKAEGTKPVGLTAARQLPCAEEGSCQFSKKCTEHDPFAPFRMKGSIAISESEKLIQICILRDTGASQSLCLAGVLPQRRPLLVAVL